MPILSLLTLRTIIAIGAIWATDLQYGPHPVGFRHEWAFDHDRTYRTASDDGATYGNENSPRPIFINMWYPARATALAPRMPHLQYFNIPDSDDRIAALALALRTYETDVMMTELLGSTEPEFTGGERNTFNNWLLRTTPCVFNATPAGGHYPLVIYHSGARSSFEDNATMCAYLASHGYIVLGSPFIEADGSSFNIDGEEGSARDIAFLIDWAKQQPHTDTDRIALIGHSAGGQAIMNYAAAPDSTHDCLVVLDTTQDYYTLRMPLHDEFEERVLAARKNLDEPMLIAASPEAIFHLCDQLSHADRIYLTLPDLGHNEFISQGVRRLELAAVLGKPEPEEELALRTTKTTYNALCEFTRAFLHVHLRDQDNAMHKFTSFAGQANFDGQTSAFGIGPHVAFMPAGQTSPPDYDLRSELPPTPRQFAALIQQHDIATICELLNRFAGADPRSPIYDSSMLMGSLMFELISTDRPDDARALSECVRAYNKDVLTVFTFIADISTQRQEHDIARKMLESAALLEPENADIAARLRALPATDAPPNSAPQ